jgi:2,3-bisphosphoglycerate-independent phosphoglycerate mutase
MPIGPGADRIRDIINRSQALLEPHEINVVRRELGENPANNIWLWGQGTSTRLTPYRDRFGLSCACIAAVDLIRGITRLLGFEQIAVPGATGFLDTDYAAKGAAAARALDRVDLVCVHIEAPDEAGHLGDVQEKRLAIERVDAHVVGPLLDKLRGFDAWRILVAPDHPTPVGTRVHSAAPPLFCLAGTGIAPGSGLPFGEANASQTGVLIDPGSKLIERLFDQELTT